MMDFFFVIFLVNKHLELRQCFFIADDKFLNGAFNRIPKVDLMADFSNLLAEIGYNEIVTEKINFDIFYKNIIGILKDIKNMGEKIPIKEKKEKISKTYINFLNKIYKKNLQIKIPNSKLLLDIISISSWKTIKKQFKKSMIFLFEVSILKSLISQNLIHLTFCFSKCFNLTKPVICRKKI